MKAFFAALQFLTVLPVPRRFRGAGADLERCAPFFPLVGLLVGALAALFDFLVSQLLPPAIASTLTVLILVKLTGGLHMDGLADTADGFFSARDRETMLAIMRDSRIGAMGVMAIVFVILIKVGALTTLELPRRTALILLTPVAGRVAPLAMMTALPYARPEGGLASRFLRRRSRANAVWGACFLVIAGGLLAQRMGVAAAVLALAATAAVSAYSRRKIGGFTGDTLGAACEIAESTVLLTAAAWAYGLLLF